MSSTTAKLDVGDRVQIPAAALEFTVEGNTIWVHAPDGSTLLRIKTQGKVNAHQCGTSPFSHCDIIVQEDINVCLGTQLGVATDEQEE